MSSVYFRKRLLLFLIPLYVIILSSIFLRAFYPFYLSQPDPCYMYLFNGMNLAGGNMEIGHIDNPGTTVQCFAAVVIFIKHIFSPSHAPLFQDVITNSESYLYTCSIVLIILFVCINYFTGAYIFRQTGNIGLSLLFQLTPLININIIRRVIELEPESFIILAAPFFMAYLFVKDPENKIGLIKKLNNKTVILFSIFSGFLIATKYTCVPVVFLVLFILENRKQRILYTGTVIMSFFFFVLPALPKIKNMYKWVWGLLSHDGIYGKGEERVVNPSQFVKNIKDLFLTDTIFTCIYCIITIAFLVVLVNRIRKKEAIPFFRTISGIWISITALILLVAKHCDFHYLIFAECCFPFGLITSYKILAASFARNVHGFIKYEKKILYSTFVLFIMFLIVEKIRYIPFSYSQPASIDKYMNTYKDLPLIISTKNGLQCERKEPALYLGYMYSGGLQSTYAQFLKEIYPNTYIYWDGSLMLTHWDEYISIADFAARNKKVLFYLKGYDDTIQVSLVHKFYIKSIRSKFDAQEIYKDAGTGQDIYLMNNSYE